MFSNNFKLQVYIFLIFFGSFFLKILFTEYFFIGSDIVSHIQASISIRDAKFLETINLGNNFFVRLGLFTHGYTTLFINWISYEFFFEILNFKVNESSFIKINSIISTLLLIPVYLFLNKHLNKKDVLLIIVLISVIPLHIFISRSFTGPINFFIGFFFLTIYFLDNLINKIDRKSLIFFSLSTFFYIGSSNLSLIGFLFHLVYILIFIKTKNLKFIFRFIIKIYFNLYSILLIIFPIFCYLVVTIISINNDINHGFILRILSKTNEVGFRFDLNKIKLFLIYYGPILILFFTAVIFDLTKGKVNKISYFFYIYLITLILLILTTKSEPSYFLIVIVAISYFVIKIFNKNKYYILNFFLIINLLYSISYVYGYPFIFKHDGHNNRVAIGTYNPKFSFDNGQKSASYLIRKKIINPGYSVLERKYFGKINIIHVYTKKNLDISTAYYLNDEIYSFDQFDSKAVGNNNYVFLYPYKIMDKEKINFLNKKNNLKLIVNICENNDKIIGIYGNQKMKRLNNKCLDNKKLNKAFDDEFFLLKDFSKLNLGVF